MGHVTLRTLSANEANLINILYMRTANAQNGCDIPWWPRMGKDGIATVLFTVQASVIFVPAGVLGCVYRHTRSHLSHDLGAPLERLVFDLSNLDAQTVHQRNLLLGSSDDFGHRRDCVFEQPISTFGIDIIEQLKKVEILLMVRYR
jgi:hypothetical protein